MNMKSLANQWKKENKEFIEKHKDDPIRVNLEWDYYLDSLCKDGGITQKQWFNHSNII